MLAGLMFLSNCSQPTPHNTLAPPHRQPILQQSGRTLLWAGQDLESDQTLWFDTTHSSLDPKSLQFGLGKDTIPAVDQPQFASPQDARLKEAGIDGESSVIGFRYSGESRAYPVSIMDRHEVVNDWFGEQALAVAW